MNKELIKQRFNKKLNLYNENARIQKQMAEKLLSYLPENDYGSVLEIGCGTGLLTEYACKKINSTSYYALDIVSDCEKYIKKINSNIKFISSDIEEYAKNSDKKFDLIVSNASLQWIDNLPDFILKLAGMLNTDGTLLFSTFGIENFREIFYVLGKTLPYYTIKELNNFFKKFNPVIEEEIRIMAFKTPKDVLKHIQNTGVNAISTEVWTKKDLSDFEKKYNNFCSNRPTLTYNPVYIMLKA